MSKIIRFAKKDLSTYSMLYKKIWKSFLFYCISIILYFVGTIHLLISVINDDTTWSWSIFFDFILAITFFVSSPLLKQQSKKFVSRHYGNTMNRFEKQLEIEQIRLLKLELIRQGYDNDEKVDDLADQLENITDNLKWERWLPVSICGIVILPIWSEYVGFRYNVLLQEKLYDKVFILVGSLATIAFFLVLVPFFIIYPIFKSIVLKSINKQYKLCKWLRRISHDYKRGTPPPSV
ncbi:MULTISPECIES: hypothetical protein [Paenibacillus]|uniref:hypothetical protein n=1 Tax=Paenibacillus TaxID=44249 RepID=UPI001352E1D8|nr:MULTISPECIES: hypothetical protein [Paenibacillus]MDY8025813.1 hypothetical protein [Paenibacillus polymyxa]MXO77695.1 hypothetical protein [Paenibacillus sp. OT2-17]